MPSPDRTRLWLALFAVALPLSALVLFLPGPGGPAHFPHEDKVVHAAMFAALTAFGLLGGLRPVGLPTALVGYAAASEVIQGTVLATRSGSVPDGLADLAGIGLGLLLVALVPGGRHTGH